jgi:hypothetical protein
LRRFQQERAGALELTVANFRSRHGEAQACGTGANLAAHARRARKLDQARRVVEGSARGGQAGDVFFFVDGAHHEAERGADGVGLRMLADRRTEHERRDLGHAVGRELEGDR